MGSQRDVLSDTTEYLSGQRKRARWHKMMKRLIMLIVLAAVGAFTFFHAKEWYTVRKSVSGVEIEFKTEWENVAEQVNLTGD